MADGPGPQSLSQSQSQLQPQSTQIALRQNQLVLVLPDRQGNFHEIPLPQGRVEETLRQLLAVQRQRSDVGKIAGATRFDPELIELLNKAMKAPVMQTQAAPAPQATSDKTAEELGL